MLARYSEARLPTPNGEFRIIVYRTREPGGGITHEEHIAMVMGDVSGADVLARVHSSCFTGEGLASLRCDCRAKLDPALAGIPAEVPAGLAYLCQEAPW